MLSLNNVTLHTASVILYKNLSVTILPSSIVHVKGANGSGKTTLLRAIAGITPITTGRIQYGPRLQEMQDIYMLQKPYCTYLGHLFGIKLEMTVLENLIFWSKIYKSDAMLNASISYFSLQNILEHKCYTLSSGTLKKVSLARLMSCNSDLWILDEPETGLDHNTKILLYQLLISKANNQGIVIIASHEQLNINQLQILDLEWFQ